MDSIVTSSRQFKTFQLDTCKVMKLKEFWRLKAICFKFGQSIKELIWESCKMTKTEVVALLNFMPNLESLSAIAWNMVPEQYEEPTAILKLDKLRTLKLTRIDKSTTDFFTVFLQDNVILDLNLQGDIETFLQNQQSIQKLELHVDSLDSKELQSMELLELKLKLRRYKDADQTSCIKNVVENQLDLKSLDVVNCEGCFDGDDGAFESICKLRNLESLKINIDDLSYAFFEAFFCKLKNLKTLEVESVSHNYAPIVAIIEELCLQEMPKLQSLKIYLIDIGLPTNRIEKMAKNFKNLTRLIIRCDHPLPLNCYLTNLPQLKALSIDYHYSKEFSKLSSNFDFKSDNLRELSLQGFGFGSDDFNSNEIVLMHLTSVVPNLEKLELDAAFPFSTEFVMKIIEKLTRIKAIKGWSLVQSGEHYKKFDYEAIDNLLKIADKLNEFSVELRLKVIDMDSSRVKEYLSKEFKVEVTRVGNLIAVRLEKNKRI